MTRRWWHQPTPEPEPTNSPEAVDAKERLNRSGEPHLHAIQLARHAKEREDRLCQVVLMSGRVDKGMDFKLTDSAQANAALNEIEAMGWRLEHVSSALGTHAFDGHVHNARIFTTYVFRAT